MTEVPYKRRGNRFLKEKIRTFINHSNEVKAKLYKKYKGKIIMEFGAGILNDLRNWQAIKAERVFAAEIDPHSVQVGITRYKKLVEKGETFPAVLYLQADLTKDKIYEHEKLKGLEGKVDTIYSQFSFHYFLKDKNSFQNIKNIIHFFLKPGGKLVITGLDGLKIYKDLKDQKAIELKGEGDDEKYMYFRIGKRYNEGEILKDLGQEIRVFVISIGTPHNEYLINTDFLKKELGLKYVEKKSFPKLSKDASEAEKKYNSYMMYVVFENF